MMGYWRAPGSVAYISTSVYVSYEPLPLWGELEGPPLPNGGCSDCLPPRVPWVSGMTNSENIPQTHKAVLLSSPS